MLCGGMGAFVYDIYLFVVEKFFRDSGLNARGQISYDDVMKFMLTPIPDY